jgi:hypothetical protein
MRTLSSHFILIVSFFLSFFTFLQGDAFAGQCWFTSSDPTCGQTAVPYCTDGKCTLQG